MEPYIVCQIGDEAAKDDSKLCEEDSRVLRVKTLHISSPILAAKSPFFYKVWFADCWHVSFFGMISCHNSGYFLLFQLFSNGMMESEQRQISLRISASGM